MKNPRRFPGNSPMDPGPDTFGPIRKFLEESSNAFLLLGYILRFCELPILISLSQAGPSRNIPGNFLMRPWVSDPEPIRKIPGNCLMHPWVSEPGLIRKFNGFVTGLARLS